MTVNFDFISDIHAEWWDEPYDYAVHKVSDMVLVGGDLTTKTEDSLIELEKIAAVYKTVLFIDGNHEFRMGPDRGYDYNFDFNAVERMLREGIALLPNVTYLLDQPYIVDGVAFVGRNGHWDYSLFQSCSFEESIEQATRVLKADFNKSATFAGIARRDAWSLAYEINRLSNDPAIREIVVATHTVPNAKLINISEQFSLAHQNRMGAGCMQPVLTADTENKVKLWLYGHQHDIKNTEIDGVTYHQNARGYKSDGQRDYKPSVFWR